ncbi:AMP-binding protein [Tomitella gaofuii]|uniref:AMP-binding protein n=1 Tax=Tomitella gaofuii TaxID=2760083 RepID=UPI0020BEE4F0|nr:AMP-binding protein [Tomitella gaofuii]
MRTDTIWTKADPFASLVAARADDDNPGLRFEDREWSWRQVVAEATARAELARSMQVDGPWHIGLLMENSPENLFWVLAAGLSGATIVGINPTRRGAELERDIDFTDIQLIVTDQAHRPLLDGLTLGCPPERILTSDAPDFAALLEAEGDGTGGGFALPDPATIFSLVFTSGTTSAPKAVICSQGRLGTIARQQQERRNLGPDDVFYVAMPMFHSNAIMAGIAPAVSAGGCIALRRKFSASAWLEDVRRYKATFFNYVGKPLNYILATPERPDDADNPLRIAFGNEANEKDIDTFSRRFGCQVIDSYGTSEGGMRINRTAGMPAGSLGLADEGTAVIDPDTLEECPRAEFDEQGRLLNAEKAIGEIANTRNVNQFEGYYGNAEADDERVRHGILWSGDMAYRDADGFWYFAGRTSDRLRVDGENFAAAPVERIVARFPAFNHVAVYAVPDEVVGDQVMIAVELYPGTEFDPKAFGGFLAEQPDLGTKWAPKYVRLSAALPRTSTSKVIKRQLQAEGYDVPDRVFVRDGKELVFREM